ncbi:MAG: hypothetical protein K9K66_10490 [Desulfarculaceae bacterium]|nr:hypothetical protein [Desulfarculaceae bacterium]MCF8074086.1 hypothetical protein [Desulfarculaceae bacterium]MCF8102076.1 hypothetical protein [Desulfarculaceae bacterium]MCF8118114.1 hypothetical protein [Desulfarculaceae bacterium]
MKKYLAIMALLLALGLLLAVAPAWARPDVSGVWHGTWTCTEQPCAKAGGKVSANMEQDGSGHLKGSYTVDGGPKGVLRCTVVTGVVSSDHQFGTELQCGSHSLWMSGEVRGDTIQGRYDGTQVGMSTGSLKLSR